MRNILFLAMLTLFTPSLASAHDCAKGDAACHYEAAQEHLSAARKASQDTHEFKGKLLLNPIGVEALLVAIDWSSECPSMHRDITGFTINSRMSPALSDAWRIDPRAPIVWHGLSGTRQAIKKTSDCIRKTIWDKTILTDKTGIGERADNKVTYTYMLPTSPK